MPQSSHVLAEETVVVPASAEALEAVHFALERLWEGSDARHLHCLDERWRAEFTTAVAEIGANIARHAHPPGSPAGRMCLRLRLLDARIEARFADDGLPYQATARARPADGEPAEPAESGYGLLIVRAAVDSLRYRRTRHGTNVWWLVKRFVPRPGA